jgi:predicted DNA-binding protein
MSIPSRSHTIRFPGDLYEKIHILADQNGRTFNGQVIYLLQIGYTVDKKYQEGIQKQIEETHDEV